MAHKRFFRGVLQTFLQHTLFIPCPHGEVTSGGIRLHNRLTEGHAHNYFEYFLITSGSIIHIVNDRETLLGPGNLVFIRSSDYHQYGPNREGNCQLINISFTASHFESACQFLGEDIKQRLLSPADPPTIALSASRTAQLAKDYDFLNFFTGDIRSLQVRLKLLLIDVLGIFIKYPTEKEYRSFKDWLEGMLEKMNTQ